MGLWTGLANAIIGFLGSVFIAGLLTNLVDKTLGAIAAYGLVLLIEPRLSGPRDARGAP
jgi:hypothetical protein